MVGNLKREPGMRRGGMLQGILFLSIFCLAFVPGGCAEDSDVDPLPVSVYNSLFGPNFNVLLVDDDEGLTETGTWTNTLDDLSITNDLDVVSTDGDPALQLENYTVVIWSIGDRDTNNLTPSNISLLSTYLDNGGRLLYSGGHNVYSESLAGVAAFINTYLGLSAYNFNMPTFLNNSLSVSTAGSGHSAAGSTTYTLWFWAGGQYGNMFSGFYAGLPSATGLLDHQSANLDKSGAADFNGFLGMANDPGVYKTVTWGFDLNHVDPADRQELLSMALYFLAE